MFNSKEKVLQKWQTLVSRLAAWFTIALLFLIPVQFFLGSQALKQQKKPTFEAINKLIGIANKVSTINSEPELRAYFASLPNPPILSPKFEAPFPVIKQRIIDNVKSRINFASNNADRENSRATQTFLLEAIRNTSQAILMAVAFSILANLSSRTTNLFTRFIYSLL